MYIYVNFPNSHFSKHDEKKCLTVYIWEIKKKTRNSFMKLIFIFDLKIIFKFIDMYYLHYKHCVQGNIWPPPPILFSPTLPS